MKQLLNALTITRILFAIALLWTTDKYIFLMICLFCGVSDFLDGFLARRLHLTTKLGAQLDSLADSTFFIISLSILLLKLDEQARRAVTLVMVGIVILRLTNLLLTRQKFKQWRVMRTYGNRATGFLLFVFVPIAFYLEVVPPALLLILGGTASLSALEEGLILLCSKVYEPERGSILPFFKSAEH